MPELPEVETTVNGLKKEILGRKIEDVWTDVEKMVKKPCTFNAFKRDLIGRKVIKVWRRAKNILIDLSGGKTMLVHQKMTGHFLLGNWIFREGNWTSQTKNSLLADPANRFLHLIFWLDNGKMLALSDLRKFAKVELWDKSVLLNSEKFKSLGPEPLGKNFTFEKFKECVGKKKGKIKKVLMDQEVLAGVGNIYSDEILWRAEIHPLREVPSLKESELERIYLMLIKTLKESINLKGESISDFRMVTGEKGGFDILRKVYRREGERCSRCGSILKRIKLGSRSSYFCPKCQKI